MPTALTTEPTVNVALASVLRGKHPSWEDSIAAEQMKVIQGSAASKIDVLIDPPNNSPVAVESEFLPASTVESDAQSRLGKKLSASNRRIEHAIALRLPMELRSARQAELDEQVASSNFSYCVYAPDGGSGFERWPRGGWMRGNIDDLVQCIEAVAMSESLLSKSADALERGVAEAANYIDLSSADSQTQIGELLHQEPGKQTNRMAAAIVANALIFHTRIEDIDNIPRLSQISTSSGLTQPSLLQSWEWIIANENYWPVFDIASRLIRCLSTIAANRMLNRLHSTAAELVELGTTGLNDMSGRMFQRLIADRKFLATFYTLPVSAALLAELAACRLEVDWKDGQSVAALRIADFACGTGALIGALYNSILGRYRRNGGDDAGIHAQMMEHAAFAFDIMPAATHLTSSTLSNAHPAIGFKGTKAATMPYGYDSDNHPNIGSLELISSEFTRPLFGLDEDKPQGLSGEGTIPILGVPHESMHAIIMNPPFSRTTGQEAKKVGVPAPAFAGFDTERAEQRAMSGRLTKINARLRKKRSENASQLVKEAGHGNAGLASSFLDLAHEKIDVGGVLAFILPFTFVQGSSWTKARQLLESFYRDITVVSIAASGSKDRAFSADTNMAEVLLIATRSDRAERNARRGESTLFVNLYRRPKSLLEAATNAQRIHGLPHSECIGTLRMTDDPNEAVFGSYARGKLTEFGGACGVKSLDVLAPVLSRIMETHELLLSHQIKSVGLPLARLGEIGSRGVHVLDVTGNAQTPGGPPRGPFSCEPIAEESGFTQYPALWNHDADRERNLVVEPDQKCIVRPGSRERAIGLWQRVSSRFHINVEFRLNSQSLAACLTPSPSIGGHSWPNFRFNNTEWEIPALLWANSTLGLLLFWWQSSRQQLGKARLHVSMHPQLLTLDPRCLTTSQILTANSIFESFADRQFLPANEADHDESRLDLDNAVLVDLLGLDLAVLEEVGRLRAAWCAEPSVHGGKLSSLGN